MKLKIIIGIGQEIIGIALTMLGIYQSLIDWGWDNMVVTVKNGILGPKGRGFMLVFEFSKGMKIVWITHISYKFVKK